MFKRWWLWITRPVRRLRAMWQQAVFELKVVIVTCLVLATIGYFMEGEIAYAVLVICLLGILIAGAEK